MISRGSLIGYSYSPSFLSGVAKVLYSSAKKALNGETWNEHVKPSLDHSKAARAFIIPFFLISVVIVESQKPWAVPWWLSELVASLGNLRLFHAFRQDCGRAVQRLDVFIHPVGKGRGP